MDPTKFDPMDESSKEKLKEKTPTSNLAASLQVGGFSVTTTREAIGEVIERKQRAFTAEEIANTAKISKKSVYNTLKILIKKRLTHLSPSLKAYFWCQKSGSGMARKSTTCHSFAICPRCKRVEEFVHEKHQHPHLKAFQNLAWEHEWLGLCKTCQPT